MTAPPPSELPAPQRGTTGYAMPAGYRPPPPNGTVAWALGFLAYIPIPFFNVLIAGVAQVIAGRKQRKHGGLAAENGRRAANWGLTQLTWAVLMGVVVLLTQLTGTPRESGGVQPPPVLDAIMTGFIISYFVLGAIQLVYAITGTVKAGRGQLVWLPAIPFLPSTVPPA
ncbi:DUF4870 domain-containing protein [Gordonia sp. FQ]|uniref:DUF4870 domain-containing protein n=1 Tax=Gordonia sp. FQ TaxID=3446634 RepID=UPI003F82647C